MSGWNRVYFTGGYIEVAVTLPDLNGINGSWPAVWGMSNLGRAGHGASPDPPGRIPHDPDPPPSAVAVQP